MRHVSCITNSQEALEHTDVRAAALLARAEHEWKGGNISEATNLFEEIVERFAP